MVSEVEKRDVVKQAAKESEAPVNYKDQRKGKTLQNKLSKIEGQILQLESEIRKDDRLLAEHPEKLVGDASFFAAYENKKKELDTRMTEWEQVQEELENA